MQKRTIGLTIVGTCLMAGYVYNFNLPELLQIPLRQQPYNFTTLQFNFIYFCTFLIDPLLDIPIGFWMGKNPLQKTMTLILSLSFCSIMILALMFEFRPPGYIVIVMIMRAIFGLTGQAAFLGQSLFIQQAEAQNYEMVMGLCWTIPFLFDSLNSVVTASVYDWTHNLPLPWFIGYVFGVISLLSLYFMCRQIRKSKLKKQSQLLEKKNVQSDKLSNSDQGDQQDFKFQDILKFGKLFWIMMLTLSFTQGCSSPFINNLDELIVTRFGITYIDSGRLLLIPYTFLAILSFLLSKYLNKYPASRRSMFVWASLILSFMMLCLYLFPNSQKGQFLEYGFVVIFLGSLSFYIAVNYTYVYTALPMVVKNKAIGTAWGFCGLVIGVSQAVIPLLNASIMNISNDLITSYEYLSLFGMSITLIPLVLSIYIKYSKDFQVIDMKLVQLKKLQKQQRKIQRNKQIDFPIN